MPSKKEMIGLIVNFQTMILGNLTCVGIRGNTVYVRQQDNSPVYRVWSRWIIIKRYKSEYEVDHSISRFIGKIHSIEDTPEWKFEFARGLLFRHEESESSDSD